MIIVRHVYKGPNTHGFALIDSNEESILIKYRDFDPKTNQPVIKTAVYPQHCPCDFRFYGIVASYTNSPSREEALKDIDFAVNYLL